MSMAAEGMGRVVMAAANAGVPGDQHDGNDDCHSYLPKRAGAV
jgi:hypothetical protein